MKHYIIVKYKPEVPSARKETLIPEISELFRHITEIEGVYGISVYPNCVARENRFDLMIEIDMERSALEAYDASVWHKQWKTVYGELIEKKTIFDRE
ncbi:MAG: Dabb family protein [Eubacteriales bacterium]